MTMDDQELTSLRRAFAAHSQPTPEPAACPPPEKIWDAVRGTLPADEVRAIVEHTALCAACAEDWRLARSLQEQEAAVAAPAPLRFAPRRRFQQFALAAAAALAVGLVGVQVYEKTQTAGPAIYREGAQATIRQAGDNRAPLPRNRFLLQWTAPAPAGATYAVQVSTEDLRVVAAAEGLRAAQYQVPASALKDVAAGSRLLWKVEADLPEGGHISSPTFVSVVR